MSYRYLAKLLCAASLLCLAAAQATAQSGSCVAANASNFNGNAIAAGNFVWFNAVLKVQEIDRASQTTIGFFNSTISFTSGDTTYQMNVPDSLITFSPTAIEASSSFDGTTWTTVVPSSFSKNVFLDGLSFQVPAGGLAGGINPVTWSGTFLSNASAVVQWQWGAAVYTQFSTEQAVLGVKPVDGSRANPYRNSDHAGTPENFKPYVTGGARGGGGSNWTGSYSGTEATPVCGPE
ncbi:MAG: hypothetical protein ACREMY_09100 [bacterium]